MPHKVGKKWKWGNIELSSKEDLRRTVYGIWLKGGSKGSFSKFWKTGKVDESEETLPIKMVFKKVPKSKVVNLLDSIEEYVENERFDRKQFEKYLCSSKTIDSEDNSMFYGLFDKEDGKCLALAYLNKMPAGCVLVAMVACVFHGYGKLLLEDIIARSEAVWLAVDPTATSGLLEYYRAFGLEEVKLDHSKWADGEEEHFFLKGEGVLRNRILDTIKSAEVQVGTI